MKQFLKKGKAEGSVLFTVVSVMLVMVVFLMSTMVLTSSANRRSYYSYFETQAQYAAQAALDAVTNTAYNEAEFYHWLQTSTSGGNTAEVTVGFNGTGIQFTNNSDQVVCKVEKTPNNTMIWDEMTQAVHEQPAYKITATASVGNGRNRSDYTVVNYIYENFRVEDESKLPTPYNTATNYVHSWTKGSDPDNTKKDGNLLQAVYSLNATETGNNMQYFGPQYSGMTNIPSGRINYNTDTGYVESLSNNSRAVGNSVFVNTIKSSVGKNFVFQNYGESAQFYGNVGLTNTKWNGGFAFSANIADEIKNEKVRNYTDLPYVYVDGIIGGFDASAGWNNETNAPASPANGGLYIGYGFTSAGQGFGTAEYAENYTNINLYCGGVWFGTGSSDMYVTGDVYMYDPDVDSKMRFNGSTDFATRTHLQSFVNNNVNPAATQWNTPEGGFRQTLGGNIFCNNASLELGAPNGDGLVINGDLIMTNPNSVLKITERTTVKGRIICAGTLVDENNKLTCSDKIICNGNADEIAAYGDGDYDTYNANNDYAAAVKTETTAGNNFKLMPFSMRQDEIFDRFVRWDLKMVTTQKQDAIDNAKQDPYVQESIACGHNWDNALEINSVDGKMYVPYTTPVDPNAKRHFIKHFNPAESVYDSSILVNDETEFETKYSIPTADDKVIKIENAATMSIPVYYHDGVRSTKQDVNAVLITESCVIDFDNSSNGGGKTIFIDPSQGGHTNSNPLAVVIRGDSNAGSTVIVNNTAYYDTEYHAVGESGSGTTLYKDTNHVPGRREVVILVCGKNGDKDVSYSSKFNIVMSGSYGQFTKGEFNIVSNPIYPTDTATFDKIGEKYPEIQYAYELVPNTLVFGQVGAKYSFANGALWNAEILMPNSDLSFPNSEGYKAKFTYREEWNYNPYMPGSEFGTFGVGSFLCQNLTNGPNIATVAYIGDGHNPNSGTGGDEIVDTTINGERLGNENSDFLHNDHQGAS